MNRTILIAGGASALSFVAGAGSGLLYARRTLKQRYEQMANDEIQEARNYFKRLYKAEYPTAEDAAKDLLPEGPVTKVGREQGLLSPMPAEAEVALAAYQGEVREGARAITEEEKITEWNAANDERVRAAMTEEERNVFDVEPPAEVIFNKNRDPEFPFIITADEYLNGDEDIEQVTLMFFTGDQALVDDHEQLIEEAEREKIIGPLNILQFGHMSRDPNVVYIRNTALATDYEVLKSDGKYSVEVLGGSG